MLDKLFNKINKYHYTILILLLIVLSINITGCNKQEEVIQPLRSIKYVVVEDKKIDKIRRFSGITEAGTESKLSFKVPGSIIYRKSIGDNVLNGEIISKIDSEPFKLQVDEAIASLEEEKAIQINAYSFYDKIRSLYVNGNAAKADLESARSKYESSKARIKVINKKIEIAKLNLSYTNLRAPSAGSIAATYAEINENVAAGEPIVLLLYGIEKIVKVTLPETLIFKINKGEKVSILFDAIPDKSFEGIVTEISSATSDSATTYPVTIKILNPDGDIKSGMSAEVAFSFDLEEFNNISKAFVVPSISVNKDNNSHYVFIVEENQEGKGIIRRRDVKIGELVSNGLEILSGVNAGEKVVTAGVSKINDGDIVKLENN
ncbi:MAG: efflux RND transporter periplasmic adaptor subunit [Vampirovibrionia bacterium]